MKTVRFFFTLVVSCGLMSCAQKALIIKPSENCAPVGSQDNVRFGEVVKAYPIERYRDPADPRMMHERHVIYRVENTPAWKLQANRNQQIIVGNLVTDQRSSLRPMISQELTAEVNRSRTLNAAAAKNQAAATAVVNKAEGVVKASASAQEFTIRKIAALNTKIDRVSAEVEKGSGSKSEAPKPPESEAPSAPAPVEVDAAGQMK